MDIMSEQEANHNREMQITKEPNRNSKIYKLCLRGKNFTDDINSKLEMAKDQLTSRKIYRRCLKVRLREDKIRCQKS